LARAAGYRCPNTPGRPTTPCSSTAGSDWANAPDPRGGQQRAGAAPHCKGALPARRAVHLRRGARLPPEIFDEFKRYYHSLDLLLIDDIQFFSGKDRTQEEFFYAFTR